MSRTAAIDCEVLIIGAGPTGLMAANLLRRSGVAVRIVEQRLEPSRTSRAFAVQARSVELFQQMGLAERVLAEGTLNRRIEFFVAGKTVGSLDSDRAGIRDTPYPFILLLPQSRTEAILIDDLSRLGVQVERGITVQTLEQDAAGVTVHGVREGGRAWSSRSAYAIGADGAHSIVRKALGLQFAGAQYAQTFMLADCRVDWPLDHAHFRVFMNRSAIGLFLPLDGGRRSRVMVNAPGADAAQANDAPLALTELESALRDATGMALGLSDADWSSRYRVHHRRVERYQAGRVFVAGDAAHIHSPAGGQGMNTGLQDAANLAWKLSAVLQRGVDAALLATYDSERRPVAEQVIALSDRMFTTMAGQKGWEAKLRDWLARPVGAALGHLPAAQHRAFRTLAELDIVYGRSAWVEDGASAGGESIPQVGARAPNAVYARHRDVFDLLDGYGFSLLALSRKPLEREAAQATHAALQVLQREGISVHLLSRLAAGQCAGIESVTLPDVFDAYGVRDTQQALFLIRPDGYIAWRSDSLDVAGCERFLMRFGWGDKEPADADVVRNR